MVLFGHRKPQIFGGCSLGSVVGSVPEQITQIRGIVRIVFDPPVGKAFNQ